MEWESPEALYFLWLVPVWLALSLHARAARQRAARAFVAQGMRDRILPNESTTRFIVKTTLWALALSFSVVAIARPRFGVYFEEIKQRGSDLYVLLDVSRSMLAEDVVPSRLERAKSDILVLLERLQGERVGLIAFAGASVIKCPLTTDQGFFRLCLRDTDTNSAPRGGTAIGDAIRKALEILPKDSTRDQSLLLITDGEDHQSYPLEAARQAAERNIAIFTVGLGDPSQGSRIKDPKTGTYIAYEGSQIWSKMDDSTLREIAVVTKGAYVPAGTRNYDLGLIYEDHIRFKRGEEATETKRKRLHERYQIFLFLALLCWLSNLALRPYPLRKNNGEEIRRTSSSKGASTASILLLFFYCYTSEISVLHAKDVAPVPSVEVQERPGEAPESATVEKESSIDVEALDTRRRPEQLVAEGIRLYDQHAYDDARLKFAAADAAMPNEALIAFGLACVYHRKGDYERAREKYLQATLAKDKQLIATAFFNLGTMESERARTIAGENPEEVPAEKRQEIVDLLIDAAGHYRECLNYDSQHEQARKNLELIRQWVKYYTYLWAERDRQQRREQSDLLAFLEYLLSTERALQSQTETLIDASNAPRDRFAKLKRAQAELSTEIPVLKEKIEQATASPAQQQGQPSATLQQPPDEELDKRRAEAIKQLMDWADEAKREMEHSADHLNIRSPAPAVESQKAAITSLEKIWEIVAPFERMLADNLEKQSQIARSLMSEETSPEKETTTQKEHEDTKTPTSLAKDPQQSVQTEHENAAQKEQQSQKEPQTGDTKEAQPNLRLSEREHKELRDRQEQTQRRTAMMSLKAQQQLEQLQQQGQSQSPNPQPGPHGQPEDPQKQQMEQMKKALQKALELSPQAIEAQTQTLSTLDEKALDMAGDAAERARTLLEEIAKELPKQDQQQQQQQGDQGQDQNDRQEQQQDRGQEQDEQRQKEDKNEEQQGENRKPEKMTRQQAEELMRRVRERERQRRDETEQMRAQQYGRIEVDKDW